METDEGFLYYAPGDLTRGFPQEVEMVKKEALAKAINLLEAYHYRQEYDFDTSFCRRYVCRLCGADVAADAVPGQSLADAVAAIPHRECVMPSIRELVGNPWIS